jgi:DNA-binding NarL/FixJ family response regulator
MRIVVAEDEQMFREVVYKICTEDLGHEVVGEASDGEEAVRIVTEKRPNLLLLDIDLPRLDGFGVADAVRRSSRGTQIVAVTSSRASYTLFRIEHSEFDGYIDKGASSLSALRQAISAAADGRRYHSPTFAAVKEERMRDPNAFDKVLSNRERQVLSLIGLSLNDDEIGIRLAISARTVETFRHRILQKLRIAGTPKLIRFAIENGFTPVSALATDVPSVRPRVFAPGVQVRH